MSEKENAQPSRECCSCAKLFYCKNKKEHIHSTKACLFFEPYKEGTK